MVSSDNRFASHGENFQVAGTDRQAHSTAILMGCVLMFKLVKL